MITIEREENIPIFASEDEEHEYWGVHDFSEELWEKLEFHDDAGLPPPLAETFPVEVYLEEAAIKQLEALAARQRTRPGRLLRKLVLRALAEDEQRQASAPPPPSDAAPATIEPAAPER
jgi:hypothetical protein